MGQISLQIPVANLPNSSEDPKVASDFTTIQALVNGNLDSTNLSATAAITRSQQAGGGGNLIPTSVSANTSATDGHLYLVTAGNVTITLPAPAAGVTVGVFAASNAITGSAPVTVTTPTGNISGVGVSATSITLGTTSSFVVLMGDGGGYRIVAGQQDTGWVTITPGTNIATTGGGYTASVRLQGDTPRLKGALVNNTGGTVTSYAMGTVGTAFRPTQSLYLQGSYGGTVGSFILATTGVITTVGIGLGNGIGLSLDGVTYSLS